MKALDLVEENASIVINRNSSIQELASGLNVQPVLKRLFTPIECTVALAATRDDVHKWSTIKENMSKYIESRSRCYEMMNRHRTKLEKVCE